MPQFFRNLVGLLAPLLSCLSFSTPERPLITLHTSLAPPYQVLSKGALTGSSVETITCIFGKMNQPFDIKVVPWNRGVNYFKRGRTDGLFIAMESTELNVAGKLSDPLALEKWYWYFRDKDIAHRLSANPSIAIGAILSSNQHLWLTGRHYVIKNEVTETEQLLHLLAINRIDTFLADSRTFHEESIRFGVAPNQIFSRFSRYMPLGIYFSNDLLAKDPQFLALFNSLIPACSPLVMHLDSGEKAQLKQQSEWVLNLLNQDSTIFRSLHDSNKAISAPQYQHNDNLSGYIQRQYVDVFTLVSEITVYDLHGRTIASSGHSKGHKMTPSLTDLSLSTHRKGEITIMPIRFHHSTHSFQSAVHTGLFDSQTNTRIGTIVLGINVEKALTQD
jgi:Bacterial extracellular solute-binding proteins, family 3.